MCRARTVSIALLFTAASFAQTQNATLVGKIVDSSQAPIAGAAVQVRDTATNEIRTTQSQADGAYTVTNLPPSVYEVTIDKPGFRTLKESNLELQVEQTARLDAHLEVGTVSETIEIKAEVPLVNTENATRGDVITTREITQMPLDGRDFNDLVFLVAGVQLSEQSAKGSPYSINGTRADATNFIIDGMNDQNPRDAGAQARPPLDSLQEFRVETSGYSAQYGRLGGGVVSMALKSGGNDFHGSLFELIRNDFFDARNFFDGSNKSKLRRNQFGATATGPLLIPKLYNGRNRTFFLASWESYRQIQGSSQLGIVPTALERQGNFSQSLDATGKLILIKDPLSSAACSATSMGGCFAGNVIPSSRLSPIGVKVLNAYPLSNLPGQVNNYLAYANSTDNWDSYLFKVDQKIGDKDNFAIRVLHRPETSANPFAGNGLGTFGATTGTAQSLIGISDTHIVTANLINEARAGFTRTTDLEASAHAGHSYAQDFGIPGTTSDPNVEGFPKFSVTNLETLGDNSSDPIQYVVNNYDYSDSVTWIKGRHAIRFGGEFLRTQYFQPTNTNFNGTFSFNGKTTNDPIADLELGLPSSTSRRIGSAWNYIFQSSYSLYAQDDFRILPNLTINAGVRYELPMPATEKYGQLTNYVPSLGKLILASAVTVPNYAAIVASAGLTNTVGLANTYGLPASLTYANYKDFAPRMGFAWRPFGGNRTVVRSGYGIFYTGNRLSAERTDLIGGFPFSESQTFTKTSNPNDLTLANPFPAALAALSGVTTASGYQLHAPPQYLQSWNFTIEREIGGGVGVEVGYVGSKGTHLGRKYDVNQAIRLTNGTSIRLYPGYNDIEYYSFGSNSSYNAATVSVHERFAHGFFLRANYTYGKSLDTASGLNYAGAGGYQGAQNSQDLNGERGRSDFDIRHSFSMNFTYELPLGRNWLAKGWQLAGTARAYSGRPFTPETKAGTIDLGEPTRPDRLANGSLPNPTVNEWFNVAAFAVVPDSAYRFGNSGRNILDGPGFFAANLSLSKRFAIGEHGKMQFRWETFNVSNHPNFNLPSLNVDVAGAGTITSAQAGRVMQFGLRYEF